MHARTCFWTALIVYLLISFVPALALPNLFRGLRPGAGGGKS